MKALAQQPPSQAPSDEWCWPIDLTHYDRSPCLSDAERQALDELMDRFAHGQRPIGANIR